MPRDRGQRDKLPERPLRETFFSATTQRGSELYSVRSESGFVEPAPFKRDAFKRDVLAAFGAELFEST